MHNYSVINCLLHVILLQALRCKKQKEVYVQSQIYSQVHIYV